MKCSIFTIVRQSLLIILLQFSPQAWALDLNHASVDELQSISGVGPKMAQRIVTERARGPFESLDNLAERVSGVGSKRIDRFKAAGLKVGPTVGSAVGLTPGLVPSSNANEIEPYLSNSVRINTLKSGALKSTSVTKNIARATRASKAQSAAMPPITPEIWLIDHDASNP
jgi:competence protein ComEA